MTRTPKPKACRNKACATQFTPQRMGQVACCPTCALTIARQVNAKLAKEAAKVERAADRVKRVAIKRIPQLVKEAQHAFNAYIRARDVDKPCVCCGRPLGNADVGGGFDCGHYRSTGSAAHLRFDERNAHGQTKYCNRHGAGRAVDYRIGLVARIGLAEVEALEASNAVHKWTREELIEIKARYMRKLKELKSVAAGCR